jgi:hypothetical protein
MGNAHLRRIIVETSGGIIATVPVLRDSRYYKSRQREVPAPACTIAWNAQQRLNKRYRQLLVRGKTKHQIVVDRPPRTAWVHMGDSLLWSRSHRINLRQRENSTMSLTHDCRSRAVQLKRRESGRQRHAVKPANTSLIHRRANRDRPLSHAIHLHKRRYVARKSQGKPLDRGYALLTRAAKPRRRRGKVIRHDREVTIESRSLRTSWASAASLLSRSVLAASLA